jgi:hypothetical protein
VACQGSPLKKKKKKKKKKDKKEKKKKEEEEEEKKKKKKKEEEEEEEEKKKKKEEKEEEKEEEEKKKEKEEEEKKKEKEEEEKKKKKIIEKRALDTDVSRPAFSSFSRVEKPQKSTSGYLRTPASDYPLTQRHIPEERNRHRIVAENRNLQYRHIAFERGLQSEIRQQEMSGSGQFSRYSDSLQAGRSGDRIPVGTCIPPLVYADPAVDPVSCRISTGVQLSGRGVDLPTLSSAKSKERVELCSPSGALKAHYTLNFRFSF